MRWGSQQWTVASLGSGAAALVALLLAVATAHWLHLTERCSSVIDINENTSMTFNFTMYSNAGLWQICTRYDNCKIFYHFIYGIKLATGDKKWENGIKIQILHRVLLLLFFKVMQFTFKGAKFENCPINCSKFISNHVHVHIVNQ